MKNKFTLLIICITLALCSTIHAQGRMESLVTRLKTFGLKLPQEQVFLHMDNSSYYLGDTIYYNAYVIRGDNCYYDEIVKEEDLDFLAESAFADACRPGNPRDTSVAEIKELYKSLL